MLSEYYKVTIVRSGRGGREGNKVFPVKGSVAMRIWGSMKLFLLSFQLYTVLSNAYDINSAGFFWAVTQKFSSCKQCIYKCVY